MGEFLYRCFFDDRIYKRSRVFAFVSNMPAARSKKSKKASRRSIRVVVRRPASRKAPARRRRTEEPKTLPREVSRPGGPNRSRRGSTFENMSLGDLQLYARRRGIPFGGLSQGKLIKKLRFYDVEV
jgi:hypothetical protein